MMNLCGTEENDICGMRIVMVLCFLAVMVIKSNIIIKEIISEDSVLYNSEVINLQQSDDLM